jgi:ribosomal protein S18 acetylase RimI-like enzyme
MWNIAELADEPAAAEREALIRLLEDSVNGGASVGFLAPLERIEAEAYWSGVYTDAAAQRRVLLVATANGEMLGSVQLELAGRANGRHRAEVQKLMVLRSHRGQGLGTALMAAAEAAARRRDRSLLVLDTRQGDTAERLYERLGYSRAGVIPRFALSSAGTLDATVIFFKELA